jgi:membrane protease YdiL (CAAX protease family)
MADWATFLGAVGIILVLLLVLARASAAVVTDDGTITAESAQSVDRTAGAESVDRTAGAEQVDTADQSPTTEREVDFEAEPLDTEPGQIDSEAKADPAVQSPRPRQSTESAQPSGEMALSTPALLANVALSQGVFAVLLGVIAWYTQIPAWAFGLSTEQISIGAVGTGIGVGTAFYGLNEVAATIGRQRGMATPTALREALAPETAGGWAVLLVVVLPIIAGFEELLFRGAVIGVVHAGFGVSPWLLAVGSSVAFGLGHGTQGRLGIVVTSVLGLGLAAVFVFTESLLVVIVAHYLINALEFIVHEGLDSLERR